jgi:hypothetical protein
MGQSSADRQNTGGNQPDSQKRAKGANAATQQRAPDDKITETKEVSLENWRGFFAESRLGR